MATKSETLPSPVMGWFYVKTGHRSGRMRNPLRFSSNFQHKREPDIETELVKNKAQCFSCTPEFCGLVFNLQHS